jgi:hypothetical protein
MDNKKIKEAFVKRLQQDENFSKNMLSVMAFDSDYLNKLAGALEDTFSLYAAAHNYAYYSKLEKAAGEFNDIEKEKVKKYADAFVELFTNMLEEESEENPHSILHKDVSELVKHEVIKTPNGNKEVYLLDANQDIIKKYINDIENILNSKNKCQLAIVKPKNYKYLNNKVANKYLTIQDNVTELNQDGQITFLPLNQPIEVNKTPQVLTLVSLSYMGELQGSLAKLKAFDMSVLNAVCSLYYAGNSAFSLEELYKTMTQKEKATSNQLEKIKISLMRLNGHRISIDVSAEVKGKVIKNDESIIQNGFISSNLLQYKEFSVTTERGKTKTWIQILDEPILFSYSKLKNNQIISVPVKLLEMNCRATEKTIAVRDYLIKEIHQMKRGYRNNMQINYDNLLKHINFDTKEKSLTQKNRMTNDIFCILDGFKEKKFIKDFKVINGQKNKITHFEIEI